MASIKCLFVWRVVNRTRQLGKQLFLLPLWPLSQYPIRPSASWAIDSEPIRARGIIVKYYA